MSDSLMPLGTDKNANCPFKQFSKFGETYIMEKRVIEMYRNDVLFGRGEEGGGRRGGSVISIK